MAENNNIEKQAMLTSIADTQLGGGTLSNLATASLNETVFTGYLQDKAGNKLVLDNMLDLIFPIGRGFIDFTDTDFSNYLGFRWERELVGLTPVGYKSGDSDFGTIGQTGGEKTHTLTVAEMPSHKHEGLSWLGQDATQSITLNNGSNPNGYNLAYSGTYINGQEANIHTRVTGGNQSHNNLQPYKVVAYWKRIA